MASFLAIKNYGRSTWIHLFGRFCISERQKRLWQELLLPLVSYKVGKTPIYCVQNSFWVVRLVYCSAGLVADYTVAIIYEWLRISLHRLVTLGGTNRLNDFAAGMSTSSRKDAVSKRGGFTSLNLHQSYKGGRPESKGSGKLINPLEIIYTRRPFRYRNTVSIQSKLYYHLHQPWIMATHTTYVGLIPRASLPQVFDSLQYRGGWYGKFGLGRGNR